MVKNLPAYAGDAIDAKFNPWVKKFPSDRKWQPTSGFLPEKFHGQRSLVGYNPWSHTFHGVTKSWAWLSKWANLLTYLQPPIFCQDYTYQAFISLIVFFLSRIFTWLVLVYTHTHTILGAVSTANSFWFSFLLSSWTDTYKVSWKDFFLLISTCGSTWGQLLLNDCYYYFGLPWWIRRKRICLQYRRPSFDLWKIPWRRKWLPTPVSLLW